MYDMKKLIIIVVILAALGFGYWTFSPFFIDKEVSEEFPAEISRETEPQLAYQGSFEGFDRIHYGSGDVKVFKTDEGYLVRFEENFNVANGPDLYVGLGKDGVYKEEAQVAELKGNIGSQNYVLPNNINLEDYNEVWIWCRAFSVGFAKARLNSPI
jgi:hypothetical protein